MESIGSIGHEQIPMEMFMCYSCETYPDDMDIGVERRSDGIHRFYRIRIDSDGKEHVLFGDTLRIDTYIGY